MPAVLTVDWRRRRHVIWIDGANVAHTPRRNLAFLQTKIIALQACSQICRIDTPRRSRVRVRSAGKQSCDCGAGDERERSTPCMQIAD
jgi:hypothetical protein